MRRRIALGLGGTLAATVLFGAGGTVAALSDIASVSTEAGAGSLSLDRLSARPEEKVQLQLGKAAAVPLRARIHGSAAVVLQVSVVGKPGAAPCPAAAALTVRMDTGEGLSDTDLCQLGRPVTFLEVDAAGPEVDLPLTVTATPSTDTAASDVSWNGYLRFTLRHEIGGFSDQQDVEVHVVAPPGLGGANPGKGSAGTKAGGTANPGKGAAAAAGSAESSAPGDAPTGSAPSAVPPATPSDDAATSPDDTATATDGAATSAGTAAGTTSDAGVDGPAVDPAAVGAGA